MEAKEYAWVPLPNPEDEFPSGRMDMLEPQGKGIPYSNIVLGIAAWSGLYFSLQYFNWRKSSEWNSRMVTCIHGALITVLSIYSAFVLGPSPLTDPGVPLNIWEWYTTILCLSYFIYDLVWCLYHQTEGPLILIHHVASIICLMLPLNYGVSGGEVVVSIAAMEITNPLLQFRWFLRESGYKDAVISVIVDALFISMFFFMRMVFGTYLLYCVVSSPRPFLVIKLGGASFCIISYIFMYMIFRYAYRKYVLKGKRSDVSNGELFTSGDTGVPREKLVLANGVTNGINMNHQKDN